MEPFRLKPIPALDGLRGLAILGVIGFHSGWLRGGSLGVDLFFVLSGFLITSRLLQEQKNTGNIKLSSFWVGRIRRLIPGLLIFLLGVFIYGLIELEGMQQSDLHWESLGALFFVANWQTIFRQPIEQPSLLLSPLAHLWSLAIEEQIYIIWPLVIRAFLYFKINIRILLASVFCLIFFLLGWVIFLQGQNVSLDRLYMGTDTRAPAMLMGGFLAILLRWKGIKTVQKNAKILDIVGCLCLCFIGASWYFLHGHSEQIFQGPLVALGVSATLLITVVIYVPEGFLTRILSFQPLRWVGIRSYGLYLWHWLVFVWMGSYPLAWMESLDGWRLKTIQIFVSFIIAALSFRFIEQPFRYAKRKQSQA